jgi:hypothetical protein
MPTPSSETAIKLGWGVGGVKFGASRDELAALWGEPDDAERVDYLGDGRVIRVQWEYAEREVTAYFDKADNYRLGLLETTSEAYTLEGLSLIGEDRPTVIAMIAPLGLGAPERDDLITGELLTFDDVNLTLALHEGILERSQWGCFWIDDDTPQWPQ